MPEITENPSHVPLKPIMWKDKNKKVEAQGRQGKSALSEFHTSIVMAPFNIH